MTHRLLTAVLLAFLATSALQAAEQLPSPAQPSPSQLYGELFQRVQMEKILGDSKAFVDRVPLQPPASIMSEYERVRANPDFNLRAFVEQHFADPVAAAAEYHSDLRQDVRAHIDSLWPVLTRGPDPSGPYSSLLPLPNPYIVPGGRFKEVYYWDSYFTMLGLEESGRHDMAVAMVNNFADLIDRFGHIPNGNRTYYLSRSQPPFFAAMVELVAARDGEKTYTRYLPQLAKEYAFWMEGADQLTKGAAHRRVVRLADDTLLNRYWDDQATPREESYREDVETARASGRPVEEMYRNLRAAAESGWDFSSRWFADGQHLATIQTVKVLPVDLNSLLYQLERTLAKSYALAGQREQAKELQQRADARKAAMQRYLWDKRQGVFVDYLWEEGRASDAVTAAALYPLYFGVADRKQAEQTAAAVKKTLLAPHGLLTTPISTGQQWDAPNGWAPLEWIAIKGLRDNGQDELARTIAQRWIAKNIAVYRATGKLVEKYDVTGNAAAGGGEYQLQDGFGWTNGVLRKLLVLYPQESAAVIAPMTPDIPEKFEIPKVAADYVKREEMIAMRDGVKLHTVIVIPKGAQRAPMILTRTPYDASHRAERMVSPRMLATLPQGDEQFVADGYIRVFQDVRGKYGSEGEYVMTRPLRGPLNSTDVDHSTDAYDTIEWLSHNVPESNGRVGMIGSSYEGFTVLMALINPHPALKVAVPMSPMVDGWRGDDWFHNGAFRQVTFDFLYGQNVARGEGESIPRGVSDDYELFRQSGSAGDFARRFGIDALPFFRKLSEHPAYDAYWQEQALDKLLAAQPLKTPTMYVASLWDQEDIYGALAAYHATEPKDAGNDRNFLVLGPWRHSGVNYEGRSLGPLQFEGDSALQFRRDVMKPFLDQYLKEGAPKADIPAAFVYETGTNAWRRLQRWPIACEKDCAAPLQKMYLQPGFGLGFAAPAASSLKFDEYISDPAKPVPYVPRPVRFADGDAWRRWLVSDQRSVADRTDVLAYVSEVLDKPLQISGQPVVNLFASSSGTDSDWVVKLIDVYPDEMASQPEMSGYQLGIAMDIFRGRYRQSLEHPAPLKAGKAERYRFALPDANHVFLPGHRVMVQIQSSWFPLYDRNPQTYVENIFFAKPGDYRKATQRIYHAGSESSSIEMPVVQGR
jgi:putative CocE/NonD family hydrolase